MNPELTAPYNKLHKAFKSNWNLKTSILSLRPRGASIKIQTKHGYLTFGINYIMSTSIDQLAIDIMLSVSLLESGAPSNIPYDPDYYEEEEIIPFNLEDFQQSEP